MTVHLPQVEAMLGVQRLPAEVTGEVFDALVSAGSIERLDLDFKQALWPLDAVPGKVELAKDVAAMANTLGGLILVGIAESQSQAIRTSAIPVGDGAVRSMQQVLADRLAPNVAGVEIVPVPFGDEGHGGYAIAVPRSIDAPHAVRLHNVPGDREEGKISDALLYPVRDGTTTRFLREHEVAQRYRDRERGLAALDHQLADELAAAVVELTSIGTSGYPYLVLVMIPTAAGALSASGNKATAAALGFHRQWAGRRLPYVSDYSGGRAVAGRQRTVVGEPASGLRLTQSDHVVLRHDGGGLLAERVGQPANSEQLTRPLGKPIGLVFAENLELAILSGLSCLAAWADHCRAGGDALIQAQLVTAANSAWRLKRLSRLQGRPEDWPNAHLVEASRPTSTRSVPIAGLADRPRDLVALAADIATEVLADFGVAEPWSLGADGYVNPRGDNNFNGWAKNVGIARPEAAGAGS